MAGMYIVVCNRVLQQRTTFTCIETNMKKLIILSGAIAFASAANAQVIFNNITQVDGVTSNYSGFGVSYGGASAGLTKMSASLLTTTATGTITQATFAVFNNNGATVSARARIRFYADDATGGPGTGPGTYIAGYSFNAFAFTAGTTNLTGTGLSIAVPANQKIWAALCFDNVSVTTTTDAQLSNFGLGLFNQPASIGTTVNTTWMSTATTSGLFSNIAGTSTTYNNASGAPIVGGWSLGAPVPEPASMAALGLGALALVRKRRNNKA